MGITYKQVKDISNPHKSISVYFSPKQFKAIKSQLDHRDEIIKDLSKENYNLKEFLRTRGYKDDELLNTTNKLQQNDNINIIDDVFNFNDEKEDNKIKNNSFLKLSIEKNYQSENKLNPKHL